VATLDDYRWLVSEAAQPWLALAGEFSGQTVQLVSRLRKDLPAGHAALLMEQVALRRRARAKSTRAEAMFFTPQGLEQATDERLARCKAERFPQGGSIVDLCCGIGGDLIALAERGLVTGIDLDPILAVLAHANLRALGRQGDVGVGDATNTKALQSSDWHCDPDRRAEGRRTTRGELFSPPLVELERLLVKNPSAAIKLAPATVAPASWAERAELQWLGSRGECRQQVAWFGSLARHPGRRSATVVEQDQVRTIVGDAADELPIARGCGRYVYEPHAAVLAANLTSALCSEHGLSALSPTVAYLTGDNPVQDTALAAFEVRDVLPFDRKRMKAYCREHGIGRLDVKKRGVDAEPRRLVQELAADGGEQAVILLTPMEGKVMAIVAQRVP
jgi:hypothetical protein